MIKIMLKFYVMLMLASNVWAATGDNFDCHEAPMTTSSMRTTGTCVQHSSELQNDKGKVCGKRAMVPDVVFPSPKKAQPNDTPLTPEDIK